jgi:transposase-like protein
MLGNEPVRFGGRPWGKGSAQQKPRPTAHPAVKIAGRWTYFYRTIDQFGQVIGVMASEKRDLAAARRFFTRALAHGPRPVEVATDRAAAYLRVLDEQLPAAHHVDARYANNTIEADHGRLKARLRPMRGLKRLRTAQVIGSGHAFVRNVLRGHYELGLDAEPHLRLAAMPRAGSTQQRPPD